MLTGFIVNETLAKILELNNIFQGLYEPRINSNINKKHNKKKHKNRKK